MILNNQNKCYSVTKSLDWNATDLAKCYGVDIISIEKQLALSD